MVKIDQNPTEPALDASISTFQNTGRAPHWQKSVATFPGALAFLQPRAIRENGDWANLPPDAIDFALRAGKRIAANPDLARMAWHAHRVLFIDKSAQTHNWPLLAPVLDKFGGAFCLLLMLSGIPQLRAYHRSRDIPASTTRLTCRDTYIWARQYRDIGIFKNGHFFHPGQPGAWGLCTRILPWLLNHLNGALYRIGRLQYKTGPFRPQMRAYRHRASAQIRLLCESGLTFRTDGKYNGAGGCEDLHAWTSERAETRTHIIGNPIHPNGHAQRESITLARAEWDCVLANGDPILEIHIPEDGPMGFEACGDSLRQAADFFPKYFPDRPFKAVCCTSWFLDPTYQRLLAPNANIPRFQRECHLFPLDSRGKHSGLDRIFGPYVHDLATAPRNSSMRAAVLDHLAKGGALTSGGGLLWTDHLDKWGTQFYLRHF